MLGSRERAGVQVERAGWPQALPDFPQRVVGVLPALPLRPARRRLWTDCSPRSSLGSAKCKLGDLRRVTSPLGVSVFYG